MNCCFAGAPPAGKELEAGKQAIPDVPGPSDTEKYDYSSSKSSLAPSMAAQSNGDNADSSGSQGPKLQDVSSVQGESITAHSTQG